MIILLLACKLASLSWQLQDPELLLIPSAKSWVWGPLFRLLLLVKILTSQLSFHSLPVGSRLAYKLATEP